MLAALLIVLREVIEAGLVVGIVFAATRGVAGAAKYIGAGVLFGVIGSCIVAAFTGVIGATFSGMGQEYFNAAILAIAVIMLIWHNIWMSRHGRALAGDLKVAGQAVSDGTKSLLSLAIVVGVAVLREGSEVVLFLYGIATSAQQSWVTILGGGVLGLVLGALLSASTYVGLVAIPMRYFFSVTSALITVMAAGMAAQSVDFLERAGAVSVFSQTAWNSSGLLSDSSLIGRALHALVGYSDRPSVLQVIVYICTMLVSILLAASLKQKSHVLKPA